MNDQPKVVVSFPKAKRASAPKTDAELVADIRRAWRKLGRTIEAARRAGLRVETEINPHIEPRITRDL